MSRSQAGGLTAVLRAVLVVLLGSLLLGSVAAPDSRSAPQAGSVDTAAVDRFLVQQMRGHGIPGLTVALVEDGRVTYVQAYGAAGPGRAMEPDTPMPIGSMTKPFTAVAVLQLVEAGRVELDAPVQRYVPWFEVADPEASRAITVRQLLQHTSGLSEAGYRLPPADTSLEDGVRDLRNAQPTAPVGQVHQYFNPNYAVLAALVQEVTGRPYAEVVQEGILDPLGMAGSSADPGAPPEGMADGYITMFGMPIQQDAPVRRHRDGADNIVSTAADLAQFGIAVDADDSPVLSDSSRQAMADPIGGQDVGYGLGWEVWESGGVRMVGHAGLDPTFTGELAMLPDQDAGLVVLTNHGHLGERLLATPQIREGLVAALTGQQPEARGLPWRGVAAVLFLGFLAVVFSTVRGLVRLRGWPERSRHLSRGRQAWEIGSHVLTAAVVVLLMYWVIPKLIGRSFNLVEVGRYHLPDLTLLVVASVLGDVLVGLLMLVLLLAPRHRDPGTA